MNKRLLTGLFFLIISTAFVMPIPDAAAQGGTYTDPAAVGVPVDSIVQIGPMNTSNYDVTITVLETRRGGRAMDMLKTAAAGIKTPGAGNEYLLARIRFELKGRAASDRGAFELGDTPFQWVAFSSDFSQYNAAPVTPPQPVLQGTVHAGETMEGWLAFEVEKKEQHPILIFDPASGGSFGRGKKLFFKLD